MDQLKCYAIYDVKTKLYDSPMYFLDEAYAVRAFAGRINQGNNPYSDFPEDFTLFFMGIFDARTGGYKSEKTPFPVLTALQAKTLINK